MAGLIVEGAAPRADCFRVGVGLRLRIWLPRSCGDGENDRFNPLMSGGGAYDAACVCADMEEPVEGRERDGEGGGSSIAVPALSSRIFFFSTPESKISSLSSALRWWTLSTHTGAHWRTVDGGEREHAFRGQR